jgi:hypothetical protein
MKKFLLMFLISLSVEADIVSDSYLVCKAIETTKMSQGCQVNGKVIDVVLDMNIVEARKTCTVIVSMIATKTQSFRNGDYKLRIFSPIYKEIPTASCNFF